MTQIKIAEKQARMDACLTLGFSEYFTQDLDDMPNQATSNSGTLTKWREGEVRDLTFTIATKEIKSAQSGTTYALLQTDQGQLKAWKNTYAKLEAGKTYKAAVEGTIWNGQLLLVLIRIYQETA